jgi:hypothetical protein
MESNYNDWTEIVEDVSITYFFFGGGGGTLSLVTVVPELQTPADFHM